jgi:hypothetical protein
MCRFTTASLALLAMIGATGCEDGPTQPFSPAPAAAASTWNDTHGSQTDPATKDFSYLHGGTNANIICDGPTMTKTWANMDNQPILPPVGGGGLDMAGPDCALSGAGSCSWTGLTIEQAEQTLCQSTNEGDLFGDGELTNCWGNNGEVCAHYIVTTHKIDFMTFDVQGLGGYNGAIIATGCPGTISNNHTYVLPMLSQMQKDNRLWEVDWNAPKGPNDWRNEVTSAILCTFAPGLAIDPDCNTSGRCIEGNFGDVGYLAVTPVGAVLWSPNINAPQPTPSVLYREDVYLTKVMPYAAAAPFLKIDGVGPTASPGVLNNQVNKPCVLQFGVSFGDFLNDCVEVDGDATKNNAEYNKLVGGITHNDERWSFDTTGIDINFASGHLGLTQVLNDTSLPATTDVSSSFYVDQNTLGPLVEDYAANDPANPRDLHGYGLVYLQFLRRAQADLNAALATQNPAFNHFIGDMTCTGDPPKSMPMAGCTGLETAITPLEASFISGTPVLPGVAPLSGKEVTSLLNAAIPSAIDVNSTTAPDVLQQMKIGLKPGHQKTAFCDDHSVTGLDTCDEAWLGDTFPNSFNRVLRVVANNNALAMPLDAQDSRFFFKEWTYALIQYFKAEGAAATAGIDPSSITLADVAAQTFDPYDLFFDSNGAGQFESAEYIERAFATSSTPPLDFSISADIKNGIFNDYYFERYLYRGETAMYSAMNDQRKGASVLASQDTALLTNIFGSTVLRTGWSDHTKDPGNNNNPTYTAFYCATNKDPTHCGKDLPPLNPDGSIMLDEGGQPLLSHYEGAFGSNATAFTLGQGQNPSAAVPVTLVKGQGDTSAKDGTFPDIQEALISVPLHVNPYDQTSAPPANGNPAIEVLVPWAPKQPGVGFPVSLDGSRDRFIETYQLDLSGVQISANIDYDFVLDKTGQPAIPAQLLFLAVETADFLGDVFLCQDKSTRDLLTARMYTSVATILDWLAAHPTAYNDCQIIIHYSPYGNYPDFISSISNGVRLGVTQGGGYGRIVDATLFDPTLPDN